MHSYIERRDFEGGREHYTYSQVFYNDGTPKVRDAAFSTLEVIPKLVGMKPLERSLEKLDDLRKKVNEMIGTAGNSQIPSATLGTLQNGSGSSPSEGDGKESLFLKRLKLQKDWVNLPRHSGKGRRN